MKKPFALFQSNLLNFDFVSILVLFCSLFMLFWLYFVHKKLFSIIFVCLNVLSLSFCDKIFMSKTTTKKQCPSWPTGREVMTTSVATRVDMRTTKVKFFKKCLSEWMIDPGKIIRPEDECFLPEGG